MTVGAARTLVLAVWAAAFIVLWALDEGQRYLGPRTQWVIPFGAITLTATALAQGAIATSRRRRSRPLTRGEAAGSVALLLPILALLVVPRPELGAQAASKKRASNAVLIAQLPSSDSRATIAEKGTLDASFIDVAVASLSPKEGSALGLPAGARVRLHGLVVHESDVPGTFGLARFFISCCAADALPIVIPVDPGKAARPPEDDWRLVTGTLARRGARLVVVAAGMEKTDEPDSPYVSANDGGGAAPPAVAPPAPAVRSKPKPTPSGRSAGFGGRAARVYEQYYEHCKEFTYEALVWPQQAPNAREAARMFAGPPRQYQPPAFRGCLAGLNAGEARIDLKELLTGMAQNVGEGG